MIIGVILSTIKHKISLTKTYLNSFANFLLNKTNYNKEELEDLFLFVSVNKYP